MFTIKHIAANGHEFAVEAVSYSVEPLPFENVEGTVGGFDIRIMGYDQPHMSGDSVGLWYGRKECGPGLGNDAIYVMNSKGATIASHYFSLPGATSPGKAQADPAFVTSNQNVTGGITHEL
jgi:hypothetical protein